MIYDEATMDFDFTDAQTALQTRARTFAGGTIGSAASRIDSTDEFPRDVIAKAGRARLIITTDDEAVLRATLVAEAFAGASATVALAVSVNALVGQAIARFGAAEFRDRVGQLEA